MPRKKSADLVPSSVSPGEIIISAAEIYAGEDIEIEDANGNRVVIPLSRWLRWPSVRENFRPVAENTDPSGSIEPPTGDKTEEN